MTAAPPRGANGAFQMSDKKIRVGIIGLSTERGWTAQSHLPALKAMPQFEIAAVATTRQETADASAKKYGVPRAFGNWRDMVAQKDIDFVIVSVKVPYHRELTLGAIAAGKPVLCEWPLGLNTAEAVEMTEAAKKAGVLNMVGLQGRANPTLNLVRDLVQRGEIGKVISASMIMSLANVGAKTPATEVYRADASWGATALQVPTGHSVDAVCYCLGEFKELSAIVAVQHKETEVVGTGKVIPVTAPDQVLLTGTLESGAVVNVHIKIDMCVPTGVRFEINGTEGDIVVASRLPIGKAPVGTQRAEMSVMMAKRGTDFVEVAVPASFNLVPAEVPKGPPFYTAQLLARMAEGIRTGKSVYPDFADAVTRHRMLDAIQKASDTGQRQSYKF
jgi:predicted dehydrogenase